MSTLCSKSKNGFLDFLGFGPVGIGVRPSIWLARGAAGHHHFGYRLFRNFCLFPAWTAGLAKASIEHSVYGLARFSSASRHCIEE